MYRIHTLHTTTNLRYQVEISSLPKVSNTQPWGPLMAQRGAKGRLLVRKIRRAVTTKRVPWHEYVEMPLIASSDLLSWEQPKRHIQLIPRPNPPSPPPPPGYTAPLPLLRLVLYMYIRGLGELKSEAWQRLKT